MGAPHKKERGLEDLLAQPSPCQDCSNYSRCSAEELACRDFRVYVAEGEIINTLAREHPTRIIYKGIFKGIFNRA